MQMRTLLISSLATTLLVVGCGQEEPSAPSTGTGAPLTAQAVSTRTAGLAAAVAEEVAASLDSLSATNPWQSFENMMMALDDLFAPLAPTVAVPLCDPTLDPGCGEASPPEPCDPDVDPSCAEPPPCDPATDPTCSEPPPADLEADLRGMLEELIFNDESLETATATRATFRLRGDVVCPTMVECSGSTCVPGEICEPVEPTCTETVDTECISFVDDLEVRVTATLVEPAGVDLAFFVAPARHAVGTLSLAPGEIAAETDLAAAKSALTFILETANAHGLDTSDAPALPRVLSGRIGATLSVPATESFAATFSILEAVDVAVDLTDGTITAHLDQAAPAISVSADGIAGIAGLLIDVGAVDFSLPYAQVYPDTMAPGTLSFHFGGLSFDLDFDEAVEALTLTNVGAGDSTTTVYKDADQLFSLDLNATAGRRFDITATPTADGSSAQIAITPKFDLELALGFAAIAADLFDPPTFIMDETISVLLDGAIGATVEPVPADPLGTFDGGLKIVQGSLSLSSSAATTAPLVVAEGQCLIARSDTDPRPGETHELLRLLDAGACP